MADVGSRKQPQGYGARPRNSDLTPPLCAAPSPRARAALFRSAQSQDNSASRHFSDRPPPRGSDNRQPHPPYFAESAESQVATSRTHRSHRANSLLLKSLRPHSIG